MRRSGCGTAFVRPKSLRGIWFDSRPTTFMRGRLTGKARFSVDGRRLSKKTAAGSSPAPAIYVGSSKKGPLLSPTGGAPPSGRWEIGRAAPVTRWVDAGSIPARRTNKRGLPKMSAAPSIKNPTRFIDNPVEAIGSDPTRIAFTITNRIPKSSRSSSAVERWWDNHQRSRGSTPAFYIVGRVAQYVKLYYVPLYDLWLVHWLQKTMAVTVQVIRQRRSNVKCTGLATGRKCCCSVVVRFHARPFVDVVQW